MSVKMKCSVIQDLLPSYVDDICSADTKELVQEHVAGCEQCKKKMEQMKNTEIVAGKASKEQVDYLKKIHSAFAQKKRLGQAILVILTGVAYVGLFAGGGGLLDYPNISSLIFSVLFFCAAILAGNYKFSGGKVRAVEIGISAVTFAFVVVLYSYFTQALVGWSQDTSGELMFPFDRLEPYQIGPLYANILRAAALIPVAVLLWNTFGKYKNAYATTLNITAISYIVYANDGLYHMDGPDTFSQWVSEVTIVQIALAVAGIVVYALLQKLGKTSAETENI